MITDMATPEQIRDTMPFAALIGVELLEATPSSCAAGSSSRRSAARREACCTAAR